MRALIFFVTLFCFLQPAAFAKAHKHKNYSTKKHHHLHGKGLKKKLHMRGVKRVEAFPQVVLPDSVDLSAQISPIQDQGGAGTCWAFAQTSAAWDTWKIAGHDPGPLSFEYMVHCGMEIGDGCNGGYYDAFNHCAVAPRGFPPMAAYPYSDQDCSGPVKVSAPIVAQFSDMVLMEPTHYNIEYVLSVLKRPVVITVAAGAGDWQDYNGGGVYDGCTLGETDHMIRLVGIKRNGAKFNKNGMLPNGMGTFIVANQWNTTWGEKGFMETDITDSKGHACNMVAAEAGYIEIAGAPIPNLNPIPAPIPPAPVLPWYCKIVPSLCR